MLSLKEQKTFPLRIEIAIPPERPTIKGHFEVDAKILTKDQLNELRERDLTDIEYMTELVADIRGLADSDGKPLEGQAAFDAVSKGLYSLYLTNAIVSTYFNQYGEANAKNWRPRR